ncbi:glycosyltransferase family 39 protein [Candidatus Woesearchaeota archaeon]|nr:glycosyltransferase family 39 protein [Candidatus Woesearchaeota archaeon]
MKIGLKKIEIIAVVILYLAALWMWTLPIQNNSMPFGDVDASSHFAIGDYITSQDKSTYRIPYYMTFRYSGQNSIFPDYLWYPPQYWTNGAIAQIVGGERTLSFFIMVAILSSLVILSSYFLIRNLFGFWPAFLSSFLLVFSTRDYMIYLWGQWPQSLSFAFTPLALYCFFKYHQNYKENQSRPVYLCIMSLFLAAQFLFHPQGMIASIGALALYSAFLAIRYKKIPFKIKHFILSFIILVAIASAFAPFNIGEFFSELFAKQETATAKSFQFDKLLKWYHGIKNDPGLPDFYFEYDKVHGSLEGGLLSWWTLPFLLLGLLALAFRRKEEDIVMLGWFVSFYFLTRLAVFGYGTRDIRMFAYEAHVFYPIIAIGLLSISSISKSEPIKKFLKYGMIAVFLVLAVSVNGASAYKILKGQENSIARINPAQYEAAEWIKANLPENADVYTYGTLGFQNYAAKIKWLGVLSQRHFIVSNDEINMTDYLFIDYTDASALRDQNYANAIQNFEKNLQNSTNVYSKNGIKVYKIDEIKI